MISKVMEKISLTLFVFYRSSGGEFLRSCLTWYNRPHSIFVPLNTGTEQKQFTFTSWRHSRQARSVLWELSCHQLASFGMNCLLFCFSSIMTCPSLKNNRVLHGRYRLSCVHSWYYLKLWAMVSTYHQVDCLLFYHQQQWKKQFYACIATGVICHIIWDIK